jgi:hypothetical protein
MAHEGENSRQNETIFDMTLDEISHVADALSQQTDQNNPIKAGSYQDFIETMKRGHEQLLSQPSYNKGKRWLKGSQCPHLLPYSRAQ